MTMPGANGRLHAYLAKVAAEGEQDCAMFQAGCHLALTGVDLAAPWRGQYQTYREGLRAMREAGYKNPKQFVQSIADPVLHRDVLTGDLCFIGNAGGVFIGNRVFGLAPGKRTLVVVDLPDNAEIYRAR